MPFDLEVHVVGLCFFRPETPEEGGRMHVLMPKAGGGGHGHHVEPHVARMMYDPAHETNPPGALRSCPPRYVRLEGNAISLPGVAGGTPMTLPAGMLNLTRHFGTRVKPSCLTGVPDGQSLAARVTLADGRQDEVFEGAIFEFDGVDVEMPVGARWTIRVPGDSLEWTVEGPGGTNFRRLHPIPGKPMKLYIYHVPAEELPDFVPPPPPPRHELPPVGDPAHHFGAYYALLEEVPEREVLPTFQRLKDPAFKGVSVVTCMTGGGQP